MQLKIVIRYWKSIALFHSRYESRAVFSVLPQGSGRFGSTRLECSEFRIPKFLADQFSVGELSGGTLCPKRGLQGSENYYSTKFFLTMCNAHCLLHDRCVLHHTFFERKTSIDFRDAKPARLLSAKRGSQCERHAEPFSKLGKLTAFKAIRNLSTD